MKELEQPNKEIVKLEDGTSVIVDKTSGKVGEPFGVPKKREIEIIDDPQTGDMIPVYKDTKERVGDEPILKGSGVTNDQKNYHAAVKDMPEDEQPSFGEWLITQKKAGATTVNIGSDGIDYGNPPKDMAWVRNEDGTVKLDDRNVPMALPIAGTKLAEEQEAEVKKVEQRQESKGITSDIVTTDIDRAVKLVEENKDTWFPVTGIVGAATKYVPGTDAYNTAQLLEGIKANIGFDKLQAMRSASPTGGALGPVSDFENRLLQATYGSLEQEQTREQFLFNIRRVKRIYEAVVHGEMVGEGGGLDQAKIKKVLEESNITLNEGATLEGILEKYGD